MADYRKLYDNTYLAAFHLPEGRDVTVKIVKVEGVDLPVAGTSQKQKRPVVYFEKAELPMVLNRTNAKVVAALYGNKTEGWIGKSITIYSTRVKFGAEMVDAIRVRAAAPKEEAGK